MDKGRNPRGHSGLDADLRANHRLHKGVTRRRRKENRRFARGRAAGEPLSILNNNPSI
jgi:hypothetical protein